MPHLCDKLPLVYMPVARRSILRIRRILMRGPMTGRGSGREHTVLLGDDSAHFFLGPKLDASFISLGGITGKCSCR
jgi:hypothetical protein